MNTPQVGDVWEINPESGPIQQYVTRVTGNRVFYTYRRPDRRSIEFEMATGLFQSGSKLVERDGKQVQS